MLSPSFWLKRHKTVPAVVYSHSVIKSFSVFSTLDFTAFHVIIISIFIKNLPLQKILVRF